MPKAVVGGKKRSYSKKSKSRSRRSKRRSGKMSSSTHRRSRRSRRSRSSSMGNDRASGSMSLVQLQKMARSKGIPFVGLRKTQLVRKINEY